MVQHHLFMKMLNIVFGHKCGKMQQEVPPVSSQKYAYRQIVGAGKWEEFMAVFTSVIQEIHLRAGSYQVILAPIRLQLNPGQYCTAYGDEDGEFLAQILYPAGENESRYGVTGKIPDSWMPGMQIHLSGPNGHGFNLPASARRVAVIQLTHNHYRLLPLIEKALEQGAAVVYCANALFLGLPSLVEVLKLDFIHEAIQWADYAAVEAADHQLVELLALLGGKPLEKQSPNVEVLVDTPVLCAGKGDCGVCSVATRKGWMRACKDGPVFDFNQLEL